MESTGEILLRAPKAYFKTKNSVEFVFIEHKQYETIEVIACEPKLGVEAPRLYLSDKVVRSRVDSSAIDGYLRSAKFAAMRRGEVPNVPMLIKSAERTAKASYVLKRLFLKNYSPEKTEFSVCLQFDFNDRDNDQGGLDVDTMEISKPSDLVPHFIDWSAPRGMSSKNGSWKSGSFRGGSTKTTGSPQRQSEKLLSDGASSDGDLTPTKPGLQKRNSSPLPPRAGLLNAFRSSAPSIETDSGKSDSSDGSSSGPTTPTHITLPRRATSPNIPFRPEGFSGGRSGRRSWRDTHSEGGSAKPPFALPVHEEEPEREEAELEKEAKTQTGLTEASFSGKRTFMSDQDALTMMMSPCTSGKGTIQSPGASAKSASIGPFHSMARAGDSKSMLGRLFSSFTSAYGGANEDGTAVASPRSSGLTARLSRLILRRSVRVQDCDDEDRDSLAPLKGPGPGQACLSHKTAPMDMSQESARTGTVSRSSSSGLDTSPSPASSWKSWGVAGTAASTVIPTS